MVEGVRELCEVSYKSINPVHEGCTHLQQYLHLWRLGFQHMNFGCGGDDGRVIQTFIALSNVKAISLMYNPCKQGQQRPILSGKGLT